MALREKEAGRFAESLEDQDHVAPASAEVIKAGLANRHDHRFDPPLQHRNSLRLLDFMFRHAVGRPADAADSLESGGTVGRPSGAATFAAGTKP